MHNPYAPPDATLADPAPASGSAFKAIGLGLAVDIVGTLVAGLVLGAIYGVIVTLSGGGQEELDSAAQVQVGSGIFYAGVVVGSFFSVLGGYVCARIAGQREYQRGAVLALISVLLGLLMTFEQYSALMSAVMAIVGGATVMFGAYLGYNRNRR
jgi:hypothetical protein